MSRAQKIARDYDRLRVKSLNTALDELSFQIGEDEIREAREELEELLACVKRCEAQVSDLEAELAHAHVLKKRPRDDRKRCSCGQDWVGSCMCERGLK